MYIYIYTYTRTHTHTHAHTHTHTVATTMRNTGGTNALNLKHGSGQPLSCTRREFIWNTKGMDRKERCGPSAWAAVPAWSSQERLRVTLQVSEDKATIRFRLGVGRCAAVQGAEWGSPPVGVATSPPSQNEGCGSPGLPTNRHRVVTGHRRWHSPSLAGAPL